VLRPTLVVLVGGEGRRLVVPVAEGRRSIHVRHESSRPGIATAGRWSESCARIWASARRDRAGLSVWAVQGVVAFRSSSDILRGVGDGLGRGLDVLRDLLQNGTEGVFTNPLVALLVGIAIGACIGAALTASGGSSWR